VVIAKIEINSNCGWTAVQESLTPRLPGALFTDYEQDVSAIASNMPAGSIQGTPADAW
jgi:hypothetical protein